MSRAGTRSRVPWTNHSARARTLGPWSSAMELVNAREKAQHDRQAKLHGIKGATEEEHLEDEAEWQPRRDPSLGPHPQETVRSLFDTCLDVLTTYVDCVESLWGIPDVIKVRLATSVCSRRKMSPEVVRLFTVGSPTEMQLPDCTQLDSVVLREIVQQVATERLQRLELGFCGRGFGDEAAALMAAGGPLRGLEVLALEGAYRLSDAGLEKALSATPSLTWLAVPQSSRLTGALLEKLPSLVPGLVHLNLADCRGIGADSLVAVLPRMSALTTLKLDFIPEVGGTEAALRLMVASHCSNDGGAAILFFTAVVPPEQVDDAVLVAVGSLKELRELSIRCCQVRLLVVCFEGGAHALPHKDRQRQQGPDGPGRVAAATCR
ncbi:hypothetical protein Vafri_2737 [Volvox africanus]|uniref:Uncharacterized protein n=1 Tax=Volvox africanus TaxID=51714 RepID=A0A8J4AS62_9CHLO|nr:hypothetical protein Vafri_2737 [Volvox africanus]